MVNIVNQNMHTHKIEKKKQKRNVKILIWFINQCDPYCSWSALTFNNPLIKENMKGIQW